MILLLIEKVLKFNWNSSPNSSLVFASKMVLTQLVFVRMTPVNTWRFLFFGFSTVAYQTSPWLANVFRNIFCKIVHGHRVFRLPLKPRNNTAMNKFHWNGSVALRLSKLHSPNITNKSAMRLQLISLSLRIPFHLAIDTNVKGESIGSFQLETWKYPHNFTKQLFLLLGLPWIHSLS